MAIAHTPAESLVQSVKRAIESPSTCTVTTLKSLEQLLTQNGRPHILQNHEKALRNTKASNTGQKKNAKLSTSTKCSVASKVTIREDLEERIDNNPSRSTRISFATEIFNVALKTLADECRVLTVAKEKVKLETSPAKTKRPLLPISPNPKTRSSIRDKDTEAISESRRHTRSVIEVVAQCAQRALTALRDLQRQDSEQGKSSRVQLLQATTILIGKLISLEFADLAWTELRIAKSLIEPFQDEQQVYEGAPPKLQNPASLLLMREVPNNQAVSKLAISFTIQVLKACALRGFKAITEELISLLESKQDGPIKFMLDCLQAKQITSEYADQQLASMCQSMLGLSRACTGTTPQIPRQCTRHLFRLQCISLKARCKWWQNAGHKPDINQELWRPLSKYLSAFTKTGGTLEAEDLALCKSQIGELRSELSQCKIKSIKDVIMPSSISEVLAHIAEKSGCIQEALEIHQSLQQTGEKDADLYAAVCLCKIACLHLHNLSNSALDDVTASLSAAGSALLAPMKGTVSNLDELLKHALQLQRMTARAFVNYSNENNTGMGLGPSERKLVRTCCIRAMYNIVFFILRYVGETPSEEHEDKSRASRYAARLDQVMTSKSTTIESFFIVCRKAIEADEVPWEESEAALSNFAALAEKMMTYQQTALQEQPQDSRQPLTVRVSNLYWARYMQLKSASEPPAKLLVCLQKSIHILERRSLVEKSIGNIAEKLYRFGNILNDAGDLDGAVKTYQKSLATFSELGSIAKLSAIAAHKSFDDVWSADESLVIGKVLLGFTTTAMKLPNTVQIITALLKTECLSESDKCLLIEKQTRIISCLDSKETQGQVLQVLWRKALSVHNAQKFPLRRLRILHHILEACSEYSMAKIEALHSEICSEVVNMEPLPKSYAFDEQLARFHSYLLSSTQLLAAFQSGRPSFDHCKHAVACWKISVQTCTDWQSVKNCIEDPTSLLNQLDTLADYADMQDWPRLCLDICDTKLRLLELQPKRDYSSSVNMYSRTGLYLTQVGLSTQAGRVLGRSQTLLGRSGCDKIESLQWTLAYAEYLMSIANLDRSTEALRSAWTLYHVLFESEPAPTKSLSRKIRQTTLLAHALFIHSKLMLETQNIHDAFSSAKKCVKLTTRAWTALEMGDRTTSQVARSCESDSSNLEPDRLVQSMSQLSIGNDNAVTCESLLGPRFWPHVSLHSRCLVQLANLSAKIGLFQDTIYYSEHARKMASAVGAENRLASIESTLGFYFAKADMMSESAEQIHRCQERACWLAEESNTAANQVHIASAALHAQASRERSEIIQILQRVSDELDTQNKASDVQLPKQMRTQLRIEQESDKVPPKSKSTRGRKALPKKDLQTPNIEKSRQLPSASEPCVQLPPLCRTAQHISRLKAKVLLQSGNPEDAIDVLQSEDSHNLDSEGRVSSSVLIAAALLFKVTKSLSENGVYCVVGESAISYPSVSVSHPSSKSKSDTINEKKKAVNNMTLANRKRSPPKNAADLSIIFHEAREKLCSVRGLLNSTIDMSLVRDFCSCWNNMIFLSTVLGFDLSGGPGITHAISCLDRVCSIMKERSMISVEKHLAKKDRISVWPGDDNDREFFQQEIDALSISASLTQSLPDGWNVISMRLADDSKEMYVSKLSKDSVPFHLRLPLCRSTSDGATELDEPFDFLRCKTELLDIIRHANRTSHEGRACKNKQSKKEWWAEREALDERLKILLENVENIWFGGFRGIFSQHLKQVEPLSRFSQSFQQVLNQNLPSRRKNVALTVPLHPQVLGLFVALGHPSEVDLDDPIMDLLYFVVDILQFLGERNAYDEIDFDTMLVQTIDAVRGYHDVCKQPSNQASNHTILVLDKSLHAFPWESLPCLQRQSVSRLPSLMCLHDRIEQIGDVANSQRGLRISRTSGSYILNPSTDLKATEDTFAERFSKELPSFTHIVGRAPSEEEFRSSLEGPDICLYFGHGSGAQYIRGRTVRRLDRCAVTFLMGCSSSKLVECGAFEPYGVPWNYMHAGAPAVVGTLWDVTDKDIDRFAIQTFEHWGLLDAPQVETESKDTAAKSKRKGKISRLAKEREPSPVEKGMMALDSAVAKARGACLLRYLNGAAPVVYGIPVHLGVA